MDTKKHEIENIIEQVVESIVFDAFDDNFTEEEDIEYALKVLKNKIESLDVEDFEYLFE